MTRHGRSMARISPRGARRVAAGVLVSLALVAAIGWVTPAQALPPEPLRFATFNASLARFSEGELVENLSRPTGTDRGPTHARVVAEIIQRNDPDVLLVNEFDYDYRAGQDPNRAAELFRTDFLRISQGGAPRSTYPFFFVAPTNTGVASGKDLNGNGTVVTTPGAAGYGDDAFGFGNYPGQFGMVVYSKFPINTGDVRTFQRFLWKDMPGNRIPPEFYAPDELDIFRLSSKSHWDVPVQVNGSVVHLLASHPTPPVFDGPEDRNGRRNADEIRLWDDYVTPGAGAYLYDDQGRTGGLAPASRFVIVGDQNSDPNDGDSIKPAIASLLADPLVNTSDTPDSSGGPEAAVRDGRANATHTGDPRFDTADFADGAPGNLRADYVLPSSNLRITAAAVYWLPSTDPNFPRLIGTFRSDPFFAPGNGFPGSDHRLASIDVAGFGIPDPVIPEVPAAVLLPLSAGALLAVLLVRCRGRTRAAASAS